MSEGDVWVVPELRGPGISDFSRELCSQGRRMKGPSSALIGILAGEEAGEVAAPLGEYGLERAWVMCMEGDGNASPETFADFLSGLILKSPPSLILFGSTRFGNSVAPRLAIRHHSPLVTDCIDLKRSGEDWVACKPVHQGRMDQRFSPAPGSVPLFTLKPGNFKIEKGRPAKPPEFLHLPFRPARGSKTETDGFVKADPRELPLEAADRIIAGGKGVGDGNGFGLLEELADLTASTVAGSRPAVDRGWVPYERQIGLTGKKVSPRLLFASGISGAFEFTIGIKDARCIVAVNRDSAAPIFKFADLGIVGDHGQIVSSLNDALRKMKR